MTQVILVDICGVAMKNKKLLPAAEFFHFELGYLQSIYRSMDYDGYFSSYEKAMAQAMKMVKYHQLQIEKIGDIFKPPEITIFKVSSPININDKTPDFIIFSID